jgi:predicted RNA-binding Zn-ribbon protein involved in translation (DUF1610 family)
VALPQRGATDPQPLFAAVCGLFCPACTFYIASHEDPARLAYLARRFGVGEDEIRCDGCRSHRRPGYCDQCFMFACAHERGFTTCGECPELPCPPLQTFIAERPHRADISRDLVRIAEIGTKAWMVEAAVRHTCPDCGTLNSAYDLTCRMCGRDPSSPFVAEHRAAIAASLNRD